MNKDDLILINVDDHVIEPPDMFDGFIPAKYADRAPRLVSDELSDKWVFGEGEARSSGLNTVAGRPPEEYGVEPMRLEELRRGCYDVHERVKDMSINGVLASLNFPSMARFCGPFFASRVDQDSGLYKQHKAWTRPNLGGRLPSEVFLDHVVTCFIVDDFGLANLDRMNEDMITWECDYPHSDSTWPRSPEVVAEAVAGLTDTQVDKVTHLNAMRVFSFDPFALRPREQCTTGALRREVAGHDISILSRGTRNWKAVTVGQFTHSHQPTSTA
ncbi:amidohydrolase family protein [Parafrankia sp. FMc6]|uniref:amidohydrolase family protein n=1 Tax=Parafrankia soli TaxID=2599596 RepID=UPI0034D4C6C3